MTDECRLCGQEVTKPRMRARIMYDQHADPPTDAWAGIAKIVSFNPTHVNFEHPLEVLGVDSGEPTNEVAEMLATNHAFWVSYYQHSGSSWSLDGHEGAGFEDQWDGRRRAGILILDPKHCEGTTPEDRMDFAKDFLEEYTEWCMGSVYGYVIDDEITGKEYDSCWGYYGWDAVQEGLRVALLALDIKDIDPQSIEVSG